VTAASRGEHPVPQGVRHVRVDREAGLDEAAGADIVVDVVAYTQCDAEQLSALAGRVGSVVAISSASVYADDEGRTLDEATDDASFPSLPVPIPETQRTVEPGDGTYSTQKAAMERALLEGPLPATILRPCAIHGPGSSLPRELFFVQRALDGRRAVVLASRGESRFHTTSVANLAELVLLAAERPANRVLNSGDPDPPSVLEISRLVGAAVGHEFVEVLLAESGYVQRVGRHPWAVPRPLIVDMSAAERELGYRPVTTYSEAVGETIEWLTAELRRASWRDWLPGFTVEYLGGYFDYAAEDEFLAALAGS
jgi:nucleoside-diphosphate-sugar epimerase